MPTPLTIHISLLASRRYGDTWGDTPYAEALARALRANGVATHLVFRDEAPALTGQGDVVLQIVGPGLSEPREGLANLVWIISPPNTMVAPVLQRFQGVFAASERLVARFGEMGVEAQYCPQASDPALFHPGKRPDGAAPLPIVFVGANAPRARRPGVTRAIEAGLEVHVWGPGWEGVIPAKNWRGERLEQEELAEVYARARVVLNDHMPQMAHWGMMSNRSYDALASGALVVSDAVPGFSAPQLPELIQSAPGEEMVTLLRRLLDGPEPDLATRMARHEKIAGGFSFERVAERLIAAAREVLASGAVTPPAFAPKARGTASRVVLSPVARSAPLQFDGLIAAAEEITDIFAALEHPKRPKITPPPAIAREEEGVLHALMPDLRRAQQLLLDNTPPNEVEAQGAVAILHRARRVLEAGKAVAPALSYGRDASVTRLMRGGPNWHHTPEGHDRDALKTHVALWPRRAPVDLTAPIGVFLHLYYHELGAIFAERLARINAPMAIYISTDSEEKAERLRADFTAGGFPQAEIRVLPNRGRDIFPKFFGFSDVYSRHELVLHLHGKKSTHSGRLEEWLSHSLDCLLPPSGQINRILSLFKSCPKLGLIAPVVFQPVIAAAHWGANREIAEELAFRMGLDPDSLPQNRELRFPVGSMFWARRAVLEPLLKLGLHPGHFPPEAKQTDATTAHAIERLAGVCCTVTGHKLLPVAPHGGRLYARYQQTFESNGALRAALEREAFGG